MLPKDVQRVVNRRLEVEIQIVGETQQASECARACVPVQNDETARHRQDELDIRPEWDQPSSVFVGRRETH